MTNRGSEQMPRGPQRAGEPRPGATTLHSDCRQLDSGFSLYCDVLRFFAAFLVLLDHTSWKALSGGFLWQMQSYGHSAVIVFFVLSGYIITYVAFTRETSLSDYAAARLARLYSVLIPAITLTLALDHIGVVLDPGLYNTLRETHPALRALSAALFLSQSWSADVTLLSNYSYWSLPYEFWYYVFFGAAFFLRGNLRFAVLAISAAVAGPKIVMMFPVWLAGGAAYLASRKPPGRTLSSVLFGASALIVFFGVTGRKMGVLPIIEYPLLPAEFSLADYITGAGVALNLYAACGLDFARLQRFKDVIRKAAGMTFSLYLYHLPILFAVVAFLPKSMSVGMRGVIMLATALSVSAILSHYSEDRKHVARAWLQAVFRWRMLPNAVEASSTDDG